jgi:septal ring factor EnvC (AmiA/AmiB activator)
MLDVTRLSDDGLGCLLALEQLNWGVLNEPVCRSLIVLRTELLEERQRNEELRHEVEEQRSAIRNLGQEVARRQNENAVLRARNEDQGRTNVELEVERERQEGMIVRQGLKLERLNVLNQKREDE